MTYLPASIAKEYETTSLKDLARRHSASTRIVRQRLVELGVEIRPVGKNHTPRVDKIYLDREEVTQLYLIGMQSGQQIADQFGCSAATVLEKLRKWGVKMRTQGGGRPKDQKHSFDHRRDRRIKAYGGQTYSDHPKALIREARWACRCEVCL